MRSTNAPRKFTEFWFESSRSRGFLCLRVKYDIHLVVEDLITQLAMTLQVAWVQNGSEQRCVSRHKQVRKRFVIVVTHAKIESEGLGNWPNDTWKLCYTL